MCIAAHTDQIIYCNAFNDLNIVASYKDIISILSRRKSIVEISFPKR